MHMKVYFSRINRKKQALRHWNAFVLLTKESETVRAEPYFRTGIFKLQKVKQLFSLFFLNDEDTHCFSKYSLLPKAFSLKRSVKVYFVWQISLTLKIPEILLCIAQELEHRVSQEPL